MVTGKLKLGVIGVGIAFRHLHLPNIIRHAESLEIAGVAASTAASAASAADAVEEAAGVRPHAYSNAEELIGAGLDVVLLDVPIALTYELAMKVLDTGVHLVCEKPLGEDAREAASIVKAAEARGLFLGVCENFRYQPRFADVARLVSEGAIGKPRTYFLNDLHYTSPDGLYSVTPWRQRADHRGGYLLDGGSHMVAGLRAMTRETPTAVHALPASFHPDHLGGPWDTALANLSFESGMIGHLALGYGSPDREARHPKILGTTGTAVLKKATIELWRPDSDKDETIELVDTSDGVAHEWDDFVGALTRGAKLAFSPWEAVADLAVLDAVLESAEKDAVVAVRSYQGS